MGSGEGEEPRRQSEEFLRGVCGHVSGYVFTELEGADSHCALGNVSFSAAVMYDWLDEVRGL